MKLREAKDKRERDNQNSDLCQCGCGRPARDCNFSTTNVIGHESMKFDSATKKAVRA